MAARVAGEGEPPAFFDAFTAAAKAVIMASSDEAVALGHLAIGPEHLLLALHTQPSEPAAVLLSELGATHEALVGCVQEVAPPQVGAQFVKAPFTARSKETFVIARGAAVGLEHTEVGTSHLLLGLLRQPDGGARDLLASLDILPEEADGALRERLTDRR